MIFGLPEEKNENVEKLALEVFELFSFQMNRSASGIYVISYFLGRVRGQCPETVDY